MGTGFERMRLDRGWARRIAATALVLVCVACGDPGEPVASVTVGVDREEIPQGRHVTVGYRFGVFREIAAGGEPYRVLVHFLTDEEEVIWQDDHLPPLPIDQWRAGETVEYTRRVIIPPYPYVGSSTVAVGIYSPSSGERLPLLAEELDDRAYVGTRVTFAPGRESSMLFYEDGWYGQETDPASGERWRWIADRAGLTFRNPRADVTLYLDVQAAPRRAVEGPQRVRVSLGDGVLHDGVLEPGERQFLEIGLLGREMGADATVTLGLDVEPSFVPAEGASGAADERRLGARVYYAYVDDR